MKCLSHMVLLEELRSMLCLLHGTGGCHVLNGETDNRCKCDGTEGMDTEVVRGEGQRTDGVR